MPSESKRRYSDPVIGEFTVTKRKNAKRIILRIAKDGTPNVTIPKLAPYATGIVFLKQNREWAAKHRVSSPQAVPGSLYELYDGTQIEVQKSQNRNSTKHNAGLLLLSIKEPGSPEGIKYFTKVITKHLAEDSTNAIEPRVKKYSQLLNVVPTAVKYRATTSRWGSCNNRKELTFSVYVAQLPNELLDYIVIHELAHIHEMNHSADFWSLVAQCDPDYRSHRKALKEHKTKPYIKNL